MSKKNNQISKILTFRFNVDAYFYINNERSKNLNVLNDYFLNTNFQKSDSTFFEIFFIEIILMNSKQQKQLQAVYETFESKEMFLSFILNFKINCFVESFTNDFQQMSVKKSNFRHNYVITKVNFGIINNRIIYVFNFTNFKNIINTVCFLFFYVLHEICNVLKNKKCFKTIINNINFVLTID